jgi:3-dehydroquinate dehydratase-2
MKILIINGPNLNLLGKRDQSIYGKLTLDEINKMLQNVANKLEPDAKLVFFQSNCEGALIDFIQENRDAKALIINPGALAHYSYSLADALRDFPGLKVEVHLSDISQRQDWRARSVTGEACDKIVMGKKERSYVEALLWIVNSKIKMQNAKCN